MLSGTYQTILAKYVTLRRVYLALIPENVTLRHRVEALSERLAHVLKTSDEYFCEAVTAEQKVRDLETELAQVRKELESSRRLVARMRVYINL